MKKLSTILLNSVLLVIVSCSSPAKEIISDSFLESTDKSSAYSKCLDNCLVEKSLQLNKEISEPDEEKSVFQIKGLGCKSLQYGTGFFVEENIVVTNAHVVAGVNSPKIFYEGNGFDLEFISFDPNSDLAILKSENFSQKPLKLDDAKEGESGIVVAYVKDGEKIVTEVKVREKILAVGKDIFGQPGESREALSLEANIELGFSGAPIINTDSSVIGVIFSRSRGVSSTAYAVQSSEVRKILEKEPDLIRSTNCIP